MTITANSTEYTVSIQFINDRGQTKTIDDGDFKKLTFESSYFTPFMRGQLQLNNTNQRNIFQTPSLAKVNDYDMSTSGGEFIVIRIQQTSNPVTQQKITILSETYITQNIEIGSTDGEKVLKYFFVNIDYGPLMYTKMPWSTNNYIDDPVHKTTAEKQILVSDAIKHLLVNLYDNKSHPESIIDMKNWDESSSKIEYTLNNQQPPIIGLRHLMSKYVSKKHHDMGILTQNGGLYQLNSLNRLLKQASGRNLAGAIQIETEDIRKPYSNKRSMTSTFSPVHISNINIIPQKSTLGSDIMIDHSVSSYNFIDKEFKLFNEEGTISKLKEDITSYTTNREAAVQEANINKPNKFILSSFEKSKNQNSYTGRIVLQQKLINTSEKLSIPILGNLYLKGSNFVNIELTGIPHNQKMRNISGLWFILKNTTVLRPGKFQSQIICGRLDNEKV